MNTRAVEKMCLSLHPPSTILPEQLKLRSNHPPIVT